MPMYLEIAIFILVVILILLVIFLIPVLLQVWRVARDASVTLVTINQSLPLIMNNLEEITTNVNNYTLLIDSKIRNFASASGKSGLISEMLNNMQLFAPLAMKFPIVRIVSHVLAIAKGMRVFVDVFLNDKKRSVEQVEHVE
jgi:hypothetical protein